MNGKQRKSARRLAFESLIKIESDGKFSNLEIDSTLTKNSLSQKDGALYTRLVYGVTERRLTLDGIISQYSKIPPAKLDSDVRTALRLGIYQLTFMDRIPPHSAVNESVELVNKSKSGYVNAVLRSFLRNDGTWTLPEEKFARLEVKYSIPRGLCEIYEKICADESELESLLEALNREPKIALRLNRLKASEEDLLETDNADESTRAITKSAFAPDVYLVSDSLTQTLRAGIDGGMWIVQDEASRITSAAVGAKSGEIVVDTCACPGGKSFSMAIDMQNDGAVYSFDLHKSKISLLTKGAARLGIDIIRADVNDARRPREELIGKADRVLCDAPCSGLGVISKKPEIRYKNLADIENLPKIQYDVLCGASEYVKPGGVLVYSTCTLNPAENEDVVEKFLEEHPDFRLEENELLGGAMKTFLPHRDGCDGFFAAHMRKLQSRIIS